MEASLGETIASGNEVKYESESEPEPECDLWCHRHLDGGDWPVRRVLASTLRIVLGRPVGRSRALGRYAPVLAPRWPCALD